MWSTGRPEPLREGRTYVVYFRKSGSDLELADFEALGGDSARARGVIDYIDRNPVTALDDP